MKLTKENIYNEAKQFIEDYQREYASSMSPKDFATDLEVDFIGTFEDKYGDSFDIDFEELFCNLFYDDTLIQNPQIV